MTQMWITFQIGNQNVYQIRYNGCTGKDDIDDYKDMLAREYSVQADEVQVKFDDQILKTDEKVVSSELKRDTQKALDTVEMRN